MNTPTVEHYHTLTPLTGANQQQSQTLHGYISTIYKAVSAGDGRTYCLRRIHGRYLSTRQNKCILTQLRISSHRPQRERHQSGTRKVGERQKQQRCIAPFCLHNHKV